MHLVILKLALVAGPVRPTVDPWTVPLIVPDVCDAPLGLCLIEVLFIGNGFVFVCLLLHVAEVGPLTERVGRSRLCPDGLLAIDRVADAELDARHHSSATGPVGLEDTLVDISEYAVALRHSSEPVPFELGAVLEPHDAFALGLVSHPVAFILVDILQHHNAKALSLVVLEAALVG